MSAESVYSCTVRPSRVIPRLVASWPVVARPCSGTLRHRSASCAVFSRAPRNGCDNAGNGPKELMWDPDPVCRHGFLHLGRKFPVGHSSEYLRPRISWTFRRSHKRTSQSPLVFPWAGTWHVCCSTWSLAFWHEPAAQSVQRTCTFSSAWLEVARRWTPVGQRTAAEFRVPQVRCNIVYEWIRG